MDIWNFEYECDNTDENTGQKVWKCEKYQPASYYVVLTLHNHAIININHSSGDRGRMIHRRDTIAQRTTRVELHDKGESAPRRAHATDIFRLSWNLYTIKPPGSSFSNTKIRTLRHQDFYIYSYVDISRDDIARNRLRLPLMNPYTYTSYLFIIN